MASASLASPPPESDISRIDPRTHLFFDDASRYITEVRHAVTASGIPTPLVAIECPPGELELYNDKGSKVKVTPETYIQVKSPEIRDTHFKYFLLNIHKETELGNGITIPMIQQIIEFEDTPGVPKERIYFFDFDKLLSQVKSVTFAFGNRKEEDSISRSIPAYAKYIFSDHIGPEPANGRLTLLKTMFEKIGPARVYVVTSNGLANDRILNKKTGVLDPNPYKRYFVELIRQLLPTFNESHLVCTFSENTPPLFNNKGQAIVHILTKLPLSKASAKGDSPKASPKASTKASTKGDSPKASTKGDSPKASATPKASKKRASAKTPRASAKGSLSSGIGGGGGGGFKTRYSRNKKRTTRRKIIIKKKYSRRKLQTRRKCRGLRRK
jgi:hypothetical protein